MNEKNVNVEKENIKVKEGKKMENEKGYILDLDLNAENLIIRDDEKLKAICDKPIYALSLEEKALLKKVKCKLISKTIFNVKRKYIRVIFAKGVYFDRELDETKGEVELLKYKCPTLFVEPKRLDEIPYVMAPCRLWAQESENGIAYRYEVEICPNILMRGVQGRNRNGARVYKNYFSPIQLELMLAQKTEYRFVFIDRVLGQSSEEVVEED